MERRAAVRELLCRSPHAFDAKFKTEVRYFLIRGPLMVPRPHPTRIQGRKCSLMMKNNAQARSTATGFSYPRRNRSNCLFFCLAAIGLIAWRLSRNR